MKKAIKLTLMGLLYLITEISHAQLISSVPPNNPNNRFTEEIFLGIERPSLSVIGFDNGGDNQYGYGLKQILNQVLQMTSNDQKVLVNKILNLADDPLVTPSDDNAIESNSKVLQYKAFEALASYVLEHNGINSSTSNNTYNIPIRAHSVALNDFTQSIMSVVSNLTGSEGDWVKDVRSFANIARAIDLYLALENAYKEWDYNEWNDPNSNVLLSQQEKESLMYEFYVGIYDLHYNRLNGTDNLLAQFFQVQNDEVEPGNRPLKGHLAAGYALMAYQIESGGNPQEPLTIHHEAKTRAAHYPNDSQNRYYLWTYQTDAGKRYWAEGPYYFRYVLPDAIQFWHAMRARGLSNISDPFNNSWFLNPVEWLADISTPDGYTPPIDDGNKFNIDSANLLRWSDEYGDSQVGKKYNHIYQKTLQYHSVSDFGNHRYLLELAIPKRSSLNIKKIDYDSQHPNSAQQLIVRHVDGAGNMHYVYLNTESGNAIKRGEGHEQPDQLQLLYYVNEHSYLVDTGYDRGSSEDNSFRNGYKYHNTMQYNNSRLKTTQGYVTYQNYGGLESPYVSGGKARKVSNHHSVNNKQLLHPSSNVKVIKGSVDLYYEKKDDHTATYDRKVIFIEDQDPYIIDINRVVANSSKRNFVMRYHGNGSQISTINAWTRWSNSIDDASKKLYNYTFSVDNAHENSFNESSSPLEILEYENKVGGEKEPYPIQVKTFEFDKNGSSFETIGFLKVSGSSPNYTPKNKLIAGAKYAYLKQSSNVIDVIVSRFGSTNFRLDFNINDDVYIPYLSLPSGKKYGYARLVKDSNGWEIDSDYQWNLERNVQPLSVSVTGPQFLNSDQAGTWTANVFNNKGSVSYQWYRREDLNSSWVKTGATGSSYSTYFRNPGSSSKTGGVKVEVNSAGESASAAKDVIISPSSDDCNTMTTSGDSLETNYIPPPSCKSIAESKAIPEYFTIDPNYPNPFNPTTKIEYGIPEQADVTLNVYNVLGRRVATLVNETQSAGYYSANFNGGRLASGLYIGRLTAKGTSGEQFVKEFKMQLIK